MKGYLKYGLFLWGFIFLLSLNAQTYPQNNSYNLNKVGYEKSSYQSMGHVPVFELKEGSFMNP